MPIQVRQDDRIRAVASVLLLTELVHMNDYWKHPTVKTLSMEYLAPYRDHPCAKASREIDPTQSMGSAFHCYAVQLDLSSGRFTPKSEPSPFEASSFARFEELRFADLLTDFYHDAGLATFWEKTADLWDETIADCRAMLAEEDPGVFLDLFYGHSAAHLVVVPSPLNPTSFSYGPWVGGTAYAIVGPPNVAQGSSCPVRYSHLKREFQGCLFHEFSHSLLNMVEDSVPETAEHLYAIFSIMPSNKKFQDLYAEGPNSRLCFDEILIRAATALYEKEMGREVSGTAYLARQEEEYGLGWIRPLYQALDEYLMQRKAGKYQGLAEYLPKLEAAFGDMR